MRNTVRSLVMCALCLTVVAAVSTAGINKRGSGAPMQQTIFRIDTPAEGATVFGIVEVKGFVLDMREVSGITLLVNGVAVHDVDTNQPRPDVRRKYPSFQGDEFPAIDASGFVTSFLAGNYLAGPLELSLQVGYADGTSAILGGRTVIVDNSYNQAPIGALDSPRDPELTGGAQDVVSGVYPITGWAIDDVGIRSTTAPDGSKVADIEVLVDGRGVGQVICGLPRPDVANAHPDVAAAFLSGWQMNLDTTRFNNGTHTIAVRAWDTQGLSKTLGSRSVYIDNNYATLRPFGRIDWPMPDGHFFALSCFNPPEVSGLPYQQGTNIDWVSGWAVDQNDIETLEGISLVELMIDGAVIANTIGNEQWDKLPWGCFYLPFFLRNVNCYGAARPDVAKAYPQFGNDAKQAGFFFAVDTSYLLQLGFARGLHYLSVQVRTFDSTRPAVVIDRIPVVFDCNELGNVPAFGELELPVVMQDMKNTELVKGWAIDYNTLARLNFYVDGVLDGSLVAGGTDKIRLLRMDVEAKYPWLPYPFSRYNGFEYQLNTAKYVDGVHQLVIEAVDYAGYRAYWVQRPVVFNNVN